MFGKEFFQPPSQDMYHTQVGLGVLETAKYNPDGIPTAYQVHLIMQDGRNQVYIRDPRHRIEGWHLPGPEDTLHFVGCPANPSLN